LRQLQSTLSVSDFRPYRADARVPVEIFTQRQHGLGARLGVRIEEDHDRCGAPARAQVATDREAAVDLLREQTDGKGLDEGRRAVARGVVDNRDANTWVRADHFDAPPYVISAVIGDHHDIDLDHGQDAT
jgi:hypothetical protein